MGTPNVVGPEQPRDPEDMGYEERIAHYYAKAKEIVGQVPQPPFYPSVSRQEEGHANLWANRRRYHGRDDDADRISQRGANVGGLLEHAERVE